ncbi:hypothetical protein Tco_0157546 [Tanacetum coccineum]
MWEAIKTPTVGRSSCRAHKLVNNFSKVFQDGFVHISSHRTSLYLKATRFEDVVGRLKAYEERVKEEDKANDPQENSHYDRTEYSNRNDD